MIRRAGSFAARAALALGTVFVGPAAWALPGDTVWSLQSGEGFVVLGVGGTVELLRIDADTGNLFRNPGGLPLVSFLHSTGMENTFLGRVAGDLVSGSQNTAVGHEALTLYPHSQDSAFGTHALSLTQGSGNAAFGFQAMSTGPTSVPTLRNSAFGRYALRGTSYPGSDNSAFGDQALVGTVAGSSNSAFGTEALRVNTAGGNSAFGHSALRSNVGGTDNAAFGTGALAANQTGGKNSAFGAGALSTNVTGTQNSAFGTAALLASTASDNSAFGMAALNDNAGGQENAAFGSAALQDNQSGSQNSAFGAGALRLNTIAGTNSAFGKRALHANTDGVGNSALGYGALDASNYAYSNIAVGKDAGADLTSGSDNIYIGHVGAPFDQSQIKIGTSPTHTAATIAGIHGNASGSGIGVLVNAGGDLGTNVSSRRFKREVRDLDEARDVLAKLRPVSFRYREDLVGEPDSRIPQYGLLAEEVAQVAPELVVNDASGRPHSVRYELLTPLLLREIEDNRHTLAGLRARAEELEMRVSARLEAGR